MVADVLRRFEKASLAVGDALKPFAVSCAVLTDSCEGTTAVDSTETIEELSGPEIVPTDTVCEYDLDGSRGEAFGDGVSVPSELGLLVTWEDGPVAVIVAGVLGAVLRNGLVTVGGVDTVDLVGLGCCREVVVGGLVEVVSFCTVMESLFCNGVIVDRVDCGMFSMADVVVYPDVMSPVIVPPVLNS